jgi:Domain of unknown function (DUF4129)
MAAPQLPCSSESEYRQLLHGVSNGLKSKTVDAAELEKSVPFECDFSIGEKQFRVSLDKVRADLASIQKETDKEDRDDDIQAAQRDVDQRLAGLDSFERGVDSTTQPKLQEILARREFRRVGQQDGSTLLKEQILLLFIKLFSLIASNNEQAVLFAQFAAWTIVILLVAYLIWNLYKWITRQRPMESSREYIPFTPSAKHWHKWLEEARAALARGDLRGAVHFSYWAAISDLETAGAWRPDRARTPREYLRLMAEHDPARPLLADLTRDFEIIWYGNRIPLPLDCQEFMAKVEKIACH